MSLISTLKSILGLGDSNRSEDGGTTVTVEREADVRSAPASAESTDSTDETTAEPDVDSEATSEDDDAAEAVEEAEPADDEGSETEGESVDVITGIGPAYAERLAAAGIETVADLADADASAVAEETEIAEARVEDWIEKANAR